MKNVLLSLIMALGLIACTKQETITPVGEKIATAIQNSIKTSGITGSLVHIGTTYMTGSASITFDGEIMIIDQNRYNLNQLIEYSIVRGQSGAYIEFYF